MADSLGSAVLDLGVEDGKYNAAMNKAHDKAKGLSERFSGARAAIGRHSKAIGVSVVGIGAAVVKTASGIEKGMIGVQKTTGLTDDQIQKLKEQTLEFATANNVTIDSLIDTLKVAGQMGIQGVDNISAFAQAFAKLEQASDRTVAGELGAQAFSKFLDLSKEGIEGAESVASALVELGNTSKTTEGKILHTASEIVKNTSRFNLGAANILGIATALDEAGVQAEVAGSTMQRFFNNIDTAVKSGGDMLAGFIEITGLTREEMAAMLESDPSELFLRFAEGLREANSQGKDTATMLDDVDMGGIRAAGTMQVMADRVEQLRGKMNASNEAQRENVALQNEAAAANQGLGAAMTRLGNSWAKLADAIAQSGLLDGVTKVVEIIATLVAKIPDASNALSFFFTDVANAFNQMKTTVLEVVRSMVEGITQFFTAPFDAIANKIRGFADSVTGFFSGMYQDIVGGSWVPLLMDGIELQFQRLQPAMVETSLAATQAVEQNFQNMQENLLISTQQTTDAIEQDFQNMQQNLLISTQQTSEQTTAIAGSMGQEMSAISEIMKIDWLQDIKLTHDGTVATLGDMAKLGTDIGRLFAGDWTAIIDIMSNETTKIIFDMAGEVIDILTDLLGDVGDIVGDIFDTAGDLLGGAVDVVFDILPFQHGGIVTQPTVGLIGEAGPEAVIPLDRLNEFAGIGGGQVEIIQHINGIAPDEVEAQTRRAFRRIAAEWPLS